MRFYALVKGHFAFRSFCLLKRGFAFRRFRISQISHFASEFWRQFRISHSLFGANFAFRISDYISIELWPAQTTCYRRTE